MFVIKILEAANGDPIDFAGCYVRTFDPLAGGGRGLLETTADRERARRYESKESAWLEWSSSSLKAFTIEISPA